MAWYAAGTIAVTNGSAAIVGTGTAFVDNVKAGDALRGPDERIYQIAAINSATSLTLARNYAGASAAGQAYEILSTQDALAVLAKNVALLIEDFQDIADNAGLGMFGDGSVGTPSVRFAGEQGTGFWRPSANAIAWSIAGTERMRLTGENLIVGYPGAALARVHVNKPMAPVIAGAAPSGALLLTDMSGTSLALDMGLATGVGAFIQSRAFNAATYYNLVLNAAGGNVGVGHDSPSEKLSIGVNTGTAGLESTFSLTNFVDSNLFMRLSGTAASDKRVQIGPSTSTAMTFATNDTERMRLAPSGNVGIGTNAPRAALDVNGNILTSWADRFVGAQFDSTASYQLGVRSIVASRRTDICAKSNENDGVITFSPGGGTEAARFDSVGNLLVNATSPFYSGHVINKSTAAGNAIATFASATTGLQSAVFLAVSTQGWNGADAALWLGKQANGRTLNGSGTGNFAGSDYAEYMTKAAGCGMIAKGDVCGVDADGKLTQSWGAAHSFVVKSTDPSLVGGDTWANDLDPRPTPPAEPGAAPVAPLAREPFTDPEPTPEEDESEGAFAVRHYIWGQAAAAAVAAQDSYAAAVEAFPALLAAWEDASAAYAADLAAYETALAAWQAELEAARMKVDRIAFSGQVPANLTGAFAVGDYVVAAEGADDTITAIAVSRASFFASPDHQANRIGKVWAIREGRAWIDVQHG